MTKEDKIRVLHIGGNLRINGVSMFIKGLMDDLGSQIEFSVVNTAKDNGFYKNYFESFGGKTYNVFTKGKGFIRALGQARKIKIILKEEGSFDVVHSHYYSNNGLYLKMAYKMGVPTRISHCNQANANLTIMKKIAVMVSRKMINKYATHKVGCSIAACDFLYKEKPYTVVYNGINYEAFDRNGIDTQKAYEVCGLDKSRKYILHIGRFSKQKNHLFLLDIFSEIAIENSNVDLVLVGHGPLENQIVEKITELGLANRVHIMEPNIDLPSIYSISECFVLPSLWEGLSIVLIEAQAMGLKCFVSENITKESNVGLCEYLPLNQHDWAARVCSHLSNDIKFKPVIDSKFNIQTTTNDMKKMYLEYTSNQYCDIAKAMSLGSAQYKCNKSESLAYFIKAHNLGNIRGTFGYALALFEGNSIMRDRNKAEMLVAPIIETVYKKAQLGDALYQVIYGDMYSFGLGKITDYKEAIKYYHLAASLDNAEAKCDLGYCYLVGQGVEKDLKLSFKYWLESAKQGYAHSCRDVGQSYLNGWGVRKNFKKAVYWFEKTIKLNYSHGTSDLGYCYLYGLGVKKDLEKAKSYYKKSLLQDYDRGARAIMSANIDFQEFINNDTLVFNTSQTITMKGNDGLHKGTIFINNKIDEIDCQSFYNSTQLEKILVDSDNQNYASLDGVLFNKNKSVLLRYPIGRTSESYHVPESVIEIGDFAFQNARHLKHIYLSEAIRRIGHSAMDDCKILEQIKFVEMCEEIGDWAFHGCDKIETIHIGQNIKKIGHYAFGSCESLTSINVDDNNDMYSSIACNLYSKNGKVLLQYAIANKEKQFTLPKSVEKIAFRAISDAYYLEEVYLTNVKEIEEKTFYCNKNLIRIHIGDHIPIINGEKNFDRTHKDLVFVINKHLIKDFTEHELLKNYQYLLEGEL